jgi:spore maturation protein CgeB
MPPVRILVVDPGSDWSTADVYTGLVGGLRAAGQDVVQFRYGRKLAIHEAALVATWKTAKKAGKNLPPPTPADAAYLTSESVVTWALRQAPDWTIVVSGMFFHPDAFVLMRRAGLRTAILLTESPYDHDKESVVASLADVVWTNERTAVEPLRSVNRRSRYLPHAWDPDKHATESPLDAAAAAHDVVLVGTGFIERQELLAAVDWTGIDLGLYGAWPLLGPRARLRKFVRQGVIKNDVSCSLYRRAKVNLNLFRTSMGFGRKARRVHGAESLGPRAYELAATGSFFFSERRAEVAEVFGDAVPTFEGPKELQALLARWLPDDASRQQIRRALPAMVRGHSWHERAKQVVADLEDATAGRGARATVATAVPSPVAASGAGPRDGALAVV